MSEATPETSSTPADAAMFTYVDPAQLKKDIAIDLSNITGALQEQTSLFVFYASAAVRSRRQYDRFKTAVEILEAQLDGVHRTVLKEENPKTTEGQIRAAVVTDPKYRAASARLIDAQQEYRLADVAERAFDSRKDMLLQIARDAGREQAGSLRVAANGASRDRLAEMMGKTAAAL